MAPLKAWPQTCPSLSWRSLFSAQCSHGTDRQTPIFPIPRCEGSELTDHRGCLVPPPKLLLFRTGSGNVSRLMDFFKVMLPDYPRPSPSFAELLVVRNPLANPTEGTFLDDAVCGR